MPLIATSCVIFSTFPAFDEMQVVIQSCISKNFVPQVGDMVAQHRYSEIVTALSVEFERVTSKPTESLLATNSAADLVVLVSANFD